MITIRMDKRLLKKWREDLKALYMLCYDLNQKCRELEMEADRLKVENERLLEALNQRRMVVCNKCGNVMYV